MFEDKAILKKVSNKQNTFGRKQIRFDFVF